MCCVRIICLLDRKLGILASAFKQKSNSGIKSPRCQFRILGSFVLMVPLCRFDWGGWVFLIPCQRWRFVQREGGNVEWENRSTLFWSSLKKHKLVNCESSRRWWGKHVRYGDLQSAQVVSRCTCCPLPVPPSLLPLPLPLPHPAPKACPTRTTHSDST